MQYDAPIEYEVKFFPVDHDEIREKLKAAGATIKTPLRLMRRAVFSDRYNSTMKCTYVRVRDEGDRVTMSAKFHNAGKGAESQREHEITVSNFETARSIIECAGLEAKGEQQNKRETWQMPDGTLVELETWPGLPPYLEIEGNSSEAVMHTADTLGFNWDEHISDANDALYARHYNISVDEVYERYMNLVFDTK